jgi:hypothetical protein
MIFQEGANKSSMCTPYNIAVVFLRLSGFLFISLGFLGAIFVLLSILFFALGAPEWFTQIVVPQAIPSALVSPAWILWGLLMLKFSPRLATFIVNRCEMDRTELGKGD